MLSVLSTQTGSYFRLVAFHTVEPRLDGLENGAQVEAQKNLAAAQEALEAAVASLKEIEETKQLAEDHRSETQVRTPLHQRFEDLKNPALPINLK